MRRRRALCAWCLLAALTTAARGHDIQQSRGVDPEVDYESLTRFGPWDDRNYELTAGDLEVLAPNEEELREAIPAFFRVLIRKKWLEETGTALATEGPAQYPRSATQIFRSQCGGFLIDGKIYNGTRWEEGRLVVIQEDGQPAELFGQGKECLPPDEAPD